MGIGIKDLSYKIKNKILYKILYYKSVTISYSLFSYYYFISVIKEGNKVNSNLLFTWIPICYKYDHVIINKSRNDASRKLLIINLYILLIIYI